jgi:hypothetical protein
MGSQPFQSGGARDGIGIQECQVCAARGTHTQVPCLTWQPPFGEANDTDRWLVPLQMGSMLRAGAVDHQNLGVAVKLGSERGEYPRQRRVRAVRRNDHRESRRNSHRD